jgi:hypothetical protein
MVPHYLGDGIAAVDGLTAARTSHLVVRRRFYVTLLDIALLVEGVSG